MDAAGDQDLKLQRKSADLLSDYEISLSRCLWKPGPEHKALQVVDRRLVERLVNLLEPFQEWPQLLDPHLANLLPPIVNAFLENLGSVPPRCKRRRTGSAAEVVSCRYAVCKLLYTLCKIRGQKVVSRFLSHEPRHFEPMLLAFRRWDAQLAAGEDTSYPLDEPLTWEERYIILLWLSHLLLVPFDIASISSAEVSWDAENLGMDLEMPPDLAWSAKYLTYLGLKYIGTASKERESAHYILVRLSIRPDLRDAGLVNVLMRWAVSSLSPDPQRRHHPSIYHHVGVLAYLTNVLQSAGHELASEFLPTIYHAAQAIVAGESDFHVAIKSSALARKALIKLSRTVACVSLAVSSRSPSMSPVSASSEPLEEVIEYLLSALADRDTPVRYAASKAVGVITVRLDRHWARDVVQAILESLAEDMVWRSALVDQKSPESGARPFGQISDMIDLTTVNALRWHGLILTLASLLFHRSPPHEQLPEILDFLILALQFEQRSSTRSSVGTNVRDAACFGIWALSRKYSTVELLSLEISSLRTGRWYNGAVSVLQILATELVVAACLDPLGNIRRGASAALQELIGRHPDTILAGIPIVQIVDYHAVALRSRAITEVAVGASNLDMIYWRALVSGLLGWRGLRSSDTGSRRVAAKGIGTLSKVANEGRSQVDAIIDAISGEMARLEARQVEEKHGMILSISAILDTVHTSVSNPSSKEYISAAKADTGSIPVDTRILRRALNVLDMVNDRDFTSFIFRPELIAEAACHLASSVARMLSPITKVHILQELSIDRDLVSSTIATSARILTGALLRSNEEVLEASSRTAETLFELLDERSRTEYVESWVLRVRHDGDKKAKAPDPQIAYLHALGAVFHSTVDENKIDRFEDPSNCGAPKSIIDALLSNTSSRVTIEVRAAALRSLANGVLAGHDRSPTQSSGNGNLPTVFSVVSNSISDSLCMCLDDYTIDSRGDVGSLVRLGAIDAVLAALNNCLIRRILFQEGRKQSLLARVARVSAEKMDKVRIRAVACLQEAFVHFHPSLLNNLVDTSQASSYEYFRGLLRMLLSEDVDWAHLAILEGFTTSAGAGSQSVMEASRRALADFAEETTEEPGLRLFPLAKLCEFFVTLLHDKHSKSDDRVMVPGLEVFAFLLHCGLADLINVGTFDWYSMFVTIQRIHFKSTNIHKLEAAVKVYSGLASISSVRKEVLRKLASMLLHPFPKVRMAAAEALYTHFELEKDQESISGLIASEDWLQPVKNLRKDAVEIKTQILEAY